jgi:hypothetical protein
LHDILPFLQGKRNKKASILPLNNKNSHLKTKL